MKLAELQGKGLLITDTKLGSVSLSLAERIQLQEYLNCKESDTYKQPENAKKYSHYFKQLPEGLRFIDIYTILHLWNVPHNLGHAIKKLLAPGKRGTKDRIKDIKEARDTLNRELELLETFGGEVKEHGS